MLAIQELTPFPLWVAIPQILDNEPIPVGITLYIDYVKGELKNLGLTNTKFFFGGHSLGSAAIAKWAHTAGDQVLGVVLQGGYVTRAIADPARNYGAPVLTVGAEYDGWLASVTRISLSFDQMLSSHEGYSKSKYTYTTVVLPGLSHASFLSGSTPAKVQETDLRATTSINNAIKLNSQIVSAFFEITANGKSNSPDAVKTVDKFVEQSWPIMGPILAMFKLEGNPDYSSYNKQNPIINSAYEYVVEPLAKSHKFDISNTYLSQGILEGAFEHSRPVMENEGSKLKLVSDSHTWYPHGTNHYLDVSEEQAAYDIGAKMKSRAGIYDFLKKSMSGVKELTCQEMNQRTYDMVLSNWNQTARKSMYLKSGSLIKFVEDKQESIGPLWINEGSSIKNTTSGYEIGALSLLSPVNFAVKDLAGMHYCKLMSPARMIEWMYVGSLHKEHYWIPNTIRDDDETAPQAVDSLDFDDIIQ